MDFTRGPGAQWSAVAATVALAALALASGASAFAAERPFTQLATLTATDEIGVSDLGAAVALSQDGKTALVGGPDDANGTGAAWVFVRKGKSHRGKEQAKPTGDDERGEAQFGAGVAPSPDGKTALIGGPQDSGGIGAAWVFGRSG